MNKSLSFADFAAKLGIGDTFTIVDSTYPASNFCEWAGCPRDDVKRQARVTRIGKRRIDLLSLDGTKRQISSEIITNRDFGAHYKLDGARGSIYISRYPLLIPDFVVDKVTYRWSQARWGVRAWYADPMLNASQVFYRRVSFDSEAMFYGRSHAEVEHKLKGYKNKTLADELGAALPGFDDNSSYSSFSPQEVVASKRAERAREALQAYGDKHHGGDGRVATPELLADMMHWCEQDGESFWVAISSGLTSYHQDRA